MKKRNLIALLATIISIVVLLVTGCTTQTPTTPTVTTPTATKPATSTSTPTTTPTPTVVTKVVDPTYQCVSPRGVQPPVNTFALAPRLDTLDGKIIYVVQGEADPVIMPALFDRLKKDYTKTTWVYYQPSSSFGAGAPDDQTIKEAKAVIRGNAW